MRDKNGELTAILGRVIEGGSVLAIDAAEVRAFVRNGAIVDHPAPGESGAIAIEGSFDAALIGSLGAAQPLAIARSVKERLKMGAPLAFALPRSKGLFGKILKAKRTVPLEELCEALLIAGYGGIQARELANATIVWGRADS